MYIEAGKPWQNGKGERFNGSLRGECLIREEFYDLLDARTKVESWRRSGFSAVFRKLCIFHP